MLHIHRSERADILVEELGELLVAPGPDPMEPEVVAVPTRGVERWLTQRLSHRLGAGDRQDGVCANIDFPFPGTVIGALTALGCGFAPEDDPWPPERSVWPLIEVIDDALDEAFLAPLAGHLRHSSPVDRDGSVRLRRFTTARHLADLFDRYGVHRPDMIRAWASGTTWGAEPDPEAQWQAELWRRLRDRIGVPSPAERLEPAIALALEDPALIPLPERLSLFGLTRLPVSQVQVLGAIAAHRDVHLYLLHPSAALWERAAAVASRATAAGSAEGAGAASGRRADDPTQGVPSHPLLRSWGRDSREMQLVLSRGVPGASGTHRSVPDGRTTLLGHIQSAVRGDEAPPGLGPFSAGMDPRPLLAPDDDSLTVHSCHGRARQVEVVRDAILHLLEEDPTLELRDVIVMCPDIEAFAPLVHAAFDGAAEPDQDRSDLPRIRVRLADRALRQTNPLLAVASHLLDLAASRVTASEVLDLVSMEPVARRFQIDEDDLAQVQSWVDDAGVRWGIDEVQRTSRGLGHLAANTWQAGLDRLLLGVAMADDDCRVFGGVVPVDDVSGGHVELAGRLGELIARLGAALAVLAGPMPVGAWVAALSDATDRLAAAEPADAWQHEQLRRVLDEVVVESGPDRAGRTLDLAEVRSLLAGRLAGRPTRANFRTGDLTVCTLVPMRSVPHRVLCLLGLDDGVFPRHPGEDGDDLLAADPHIGDREPRSEDRQLLLDALLAATERLVVTFSGRDPRTNQTRPPAVPVSELLDVVDRTVRMSAPGDRARRQVVVDHPLQAFDARNFTPGTLRPSVPWSFDPVNLAGAVARAREPRPPVPFLPAPLPAVRQEVLELSALIRFVEHPVRAFLRERLGLYLRGEGEQRSDAVPLEMSGLEKWGVGDRLLQARLSGTGTEAAVRAERARGLLPPDDVADAVLDEVVPCVETLYERFAAEAFFAAPPRSHEVNIELPDGRLVVGTVAGVRHATIAACSYSSLAAKHRLASWVRFLALTASRPDLEVAAVCLGRGRKVAGTHRLSRSSLAPMPGDAPRRQKSATELLVGLVALYDLGMCEPLPLFCKTSAAWIQAERSGRDPEVEAAVQWTTPFGLAGFEDEEPEHVHLLGPGTPFSDLRAEAARPGDPDAYAVAGRMRFELFAHALWDDLLDHPEQFQALL